MGVARFCFISALRVWELPARSDASAHSDTQEEEEERDGEGEEGEEEEDQEEARRGGAKQKNITFTRG